MFKTVTYPFLFIAFVISFWTNALYAQQPNKPAAPAVINPVVAGLPNAPTGNVNYVRTWDAMGPITDPNVMISAGYQDVKQNTQYIDGLGRSLQTVGRQYTPQLKDMVAPVTYDAFGREVFRYLPYVSTEDNGLFKGDPFNAQKTFMQAKFPDEQVYYSQTDYEASPLNRVTKTMALGNSWAGSNKGVTRGYLVNTAADAVRIWNINNDPLPHNSNDKDVTTNIPYNPATTIYPAGVLYKNVTTDERGYTIVEFTDKDGQVVLKKVESGDQPVAPPGFPTDIVLPNATYPSPVTGAFVASNSITLDLGFESAAPFSAEIATAPSDIAYDGFLCTYYVYDDLGHLRFVIPPKAVNQLIANGWQLTQDIINELCFRYEFDARGRMTAKKEPGADWVYMVYDARDRLVFTQNGNQRIKGQWIVTLYDGLNRAVITGMMTNYTAGAVALQGDVNTLTTTAGESTVEGIIISKYPVPAGATFTALTKSHYDDYQWTNKTYTTAYNNNLDAGNNLHAVALPAQMNYQTPGLVTGSQVRVISDPNNLAGGNWLTNVNFYDDHNRIIQRYTETHKGTDVTTIRYDFTGKPICSYLDHVVPGGTPASLHVKTNLEYDHAGRLLEIWKTINDDASKKALIAKNEYNEIGQLKSKQLGHKKDDNGNYTALATDPIETLNYTYNIRGWLTGINKDYAEAVSGVDRWFGMGLSYDKGFQLPQYNGSIAGTQWRSKGDGAQRAYGFTYDKANRLLGADFTQYDGNNYIDHPTIQFDMVMGDGQNPATAYDANGNIKAMKQWGLKLGHSSIIDDLEYTYYKEGNKLKSVTDKAVDASGTVGGSWGLGDFTDVNQNTNDYGYDANGNMIADLNKKIYGTADVDQTNGDIIFNYLNLPAQVQVDGGNKGTINYVYDATGAKLQKIALEKGVAVKYNNIDYTTIVTTTTSYVDGLMYESKLYADPALASLNYTDKLQFIGHEEGRIRYIPAEGQVAAHFEYDYFIKDHLGNTRLVLTEEHKNDIYQATMETANRGYEVALFGDKVNTTEKNKGDLNGGFDTDGANQKVSKLNGTTEEGRVGPGVILKVMAGDKIKAFTYAWYKADEVNNSPQPGLTSILTNMLSQLAPGVTNLVHGATTGQFTNGLLQPGMTDLLGKQTPAQNAPRAYLNWVLLDEEEFKMADGNAIPVPVITDPQKRLLDAGNGSEIEMKKNGYLYVFVSNESRGDVYFDDIRVEHKRGALMEETHYYPFGLTMAGISSKAMGRPENNFKFNAGTELNTSLDLGFYETEHRWYDPQVGLFRGIDPLADVSRSWSPFAYASDNPITRVDAMGLSDTTIHGQKMQRDKDLDEVVVVGKRHQRAPKIDEKSQPGGPYSELVTILLDRNTARYEKLASLTARLGGNVAENRKLDGHLLRNVLSGKVLEALSKGFEVLDLYSFGSDVANGKFPPLPLLGGVLQMITDDMTAETDREFLEIAEKKGYKDMARLLQSTVGKRLDLVGLYVTGETMQAILADGALNSSVHQTYKDDQYPDKPGTDKSGNKLEFLIILPRSAKNPVTNFGVMPIK